MHARDITEEEFVLIAADLINPIHRMGAIEVVSGHHKDFGETVLTRDESRFMALVERARAVSPDADSVVIPITCEC